MSRQVKIRVRKDTILSKKFVKKIKKNQGEEFDKKKKKKGNDKMKFKKPDKKSKDKKNYWKDSKKNKSSKKKSSNLLIVGSSKNVIPSNTQKVVKDIMKLLKRDMEIKVELSKLVSKLIK